MFRKTLMTSSALALVAGAAFAAPSCDDGLTAMGEESEFTARVEQADPTTRRNLRNFIGVADAMNRAGYDEVCESIVEAVKDMAERGEIMTEEARERALGEDDTLGDMARGLGEWSDYDYSDRARTAVPFAEMAGRVNSDTIVGADARTLDGEDIGSVDGFLTETGKGVSHLIVGYGGFMNIGDREVAVPVERVKFDATDRVFYMEADEAWLEAQPDWDEKGWFEEGPDWKMDKT